MKPWDFVMQADSAWYAHRPSSFAEKSHCYEGHWELISTSQRTFCLILVSFLLISLIVHLIEFGLLWSGPTVVVTKTFVKIERVVVFRV